MARKNLRHIQNLLRSSPGNEDLQSLEISALQNLVNLSRAEEYMARQKLRALQIKAGDHNSKYFHHCLKERVNGNKILSLSLEDGSRIFLPQEIHQASISYFQNLFSNPSPSASSVADLRSFVNKCIQPDKVADLVKEITYEEIKDSIFKMKA